MREPRLLGSLASLAVAVLACSLLAMPRARADAASPVNATPAQREEATRHFVAGKRAVESQSWNGAATELRASLEIIDSPNARLELARALEGAGKLADAWTEYDRCVTGAARLATDEPRYMATEDVATAERDALERRLALVSIEIQHAPPDVVLRVGGTQTPRDRDRPVTLLVVPPGTIAVLVESGGKELARATVEAKVGTRAAVVLSVGASSQAPSELARDLPAPPAAVERAPSGLRPYVYPAAGIAVAGLATFAIAGAMTSSTYNDLERKCGGPCPSSDRGEISSGRTQQAVANVGLVAGIAGAAVAGVLFFVSRPRADDAPRAALWLGPGWLGVRGTL